MYGFSWNLIFEIFSKICWENLSVIKIWQELRIPIYIVEVVEITNTVHWFVLLLYSISWLLHVSAVACHHQGASWILLSYLKHKSNGWYIIRVVMWPVCRSDACCNRGFESHLGHGCLSVVCCRVEVSATSWSHFQRSPTDCGATSCVMKKPRKRGGHSPRWAAEPEIINKLFVHCAGLSLSRQLSNGIRRRVCYV
jgi:hypothetical protein